jgi:hypothetical protein
LKKIGAYRNNLIICFSDNKKARIIKYAGFCGFGNLKPLFRFLQVKEKGRAISALALVFLKIFRNYDYGTLVVNMLLVSYNSNTLPSGSITAIMYLLESGISDSYLKDTTLVC